VPIINPRGIEFTFILNDKSAYFPKADYSEAEYRQLKYQVNKIAGMTFDFFGKNSVRLGYMYDWVQDAFSVLPYYHIDGKRVWDYEKSVVIEKGFRYTCRINKGFKIGDKSPVSINLFKKDPHKLLINDDILLNIDKQILGFRQYPYFGGSGPGSKAPNNVQILVGFK
jgi:hypothetical protein